MNNLISLTDVTYRYDARKPDGVLGLNLELQAGEILALLGPSGAGKTTTLNLIQGELKPQAGSIEFFEELSIGYIRQSYTGDRDLSVYNFIAKALNHLQDELKKESQIRSVLSQLELTNEIESLLSDISGGQLQRVLIAKELAKNPNLIFLDEPFANLDSNLKYDLLEELIPLFKERNISVIWTTHYFEEIMPFADRILLINSGEQQALGSPQELFFEPSNIFTGLFFGRNNILNPKSLEFDTPSELVCIRPCDITLVEHSNYPARVIKSEFLGSAQWVLFRCKDEELWVQLPPRQKIAETVHLEFKYIHPL